MQINESSRRAEGIEENWKKVVTVLVLLTVVVLLAVVVFEKAFER